MDDIIRKFLELYTQLVADDKVIQVMTVPGFRTTWRVVSDPEWFILPGLITVGNAFPSVVEFTNSSRSVSPAVQESPESPEPDYPPPRSPPPSPPSQSPDRVSTSEIIPLRGRCPTPGPSRALRNRSRSPQQTKIGCSICIRTNAFLSVTFIGCGHMFCNPCASKILPGPASASKCPNCNTRSRRIYGIPSEVPYFSDSDLE